MILANLRPAQHSTPLSYFLSVQLGHWLRTAGTSPRFGRAQARPYTEEDYPMDWCDGRTTTADSPTQV